jgi:hypothetical protein
LRDERPHRKNEKKGKKEQSLWDERYSKTKGKKQQLVR